MTREGYIKHKPLIEQWLAGNEVETELYPGSWHQVASPEWRASDNYRLVDPYHELKEAEAAGKTIQLRLADGSWRDLQPPIYWSSEPSAYRIKPGPNYRPFNFDEIPLGAIVRDKTMPFKAVLSAVHGVNHFTIIIGDRKPDQHALLKFYELSRDGGKTWEPAGVLV